MSPRTFTRRNSSAWPAQRPPRSSIVAMAGPQAAFAEKSTPQGALIPPGKLGLILYTVPTNWSRPDNLRSTVRL